MYLGLGAPQEARNQALQWQVSLPERAHLKEALTTLPLMGCGGRQFPTRGTGGSFSALDRRLRSLAICQGQGTGVSTRRTKRTHHVYNRASNQSHFLPNSETLIFMAGVTLEYMPCVEGEDSITANTMLRWSSLDMFWESIFSSKHRKK